VGAGPEDVRVLVVGGDGRHSCWVPTFGMTRSCTEPITEPAAARWMTAPRPSIASSSAAASRMSPLTSSASTPARCAGSPVLRLSSTRTR